MLFYQMKEEENNMTNLVMQPLNKEAKEVSGEQDLIFLTLIFLIFLKIYLTLVKQIHLDHLEEVPGELKRVEMIAF